MFEKASRRTRLLLRVGLYGGAIFVGVPLALAHVMTQPFPLDDLRSPPAGYEEIALESEGLGLLSHEGGPDVLVHHSEIRAEGFRTLNEGDKVRFEITESPKGPRAANVTVVT